MENVEKDMTPILIKDLGMKFATEKSKQKRRYGLYQCQYCGKEFDAILQNVKKGTTKSCGCQSQKYRNPHGLSSHPIYSSWIDMKRRCYSPKNKDYSYYGERGIQVCERWLDIKNFIEDMYPSWEKGLSIDRIDVNGNYELDNCRWTTKEVQARNTREIYINNTSGYRGVYFHTQADMWFAQIAVNNKRIKLGSYSTPIEAAKAYERYVRLNHLEHNFTPALTEEEIEEINKQNKGK